MKDYGWLTDTRGFGVLLTQDLDGRVFGLHASDGINEYVGRIGADKLEALVDDVDRYVSDYGVLRGSWEAIRDLIEFAETVREKAT